MSDSAWRSPDAGVRLIRRAIWPRGEPDAVGGAVLLEAVDAFRSRNGRDAVSLREQPGQSDLRGRGPYLVGDLAYLVDDAQVAPEVVAGEPGVGATPVGGVHAVQGADATGEKTVSQRCIGNQSDAGLTQRGQHLGVRVPYPQRVLTLDSGQRMDRMGPADGRRCRLRQSGVEDLARLHQLAQRPTVFSMGVLGSTRCW